MGTHLIEARDVGFWYPGDAADDPPVLSEFSFAVDEGEFFCLLGPSGCGKTTALRLVAGFEQPDSGTVTLDGRAIEGPGSERGVVFQADDSLFNWLTAVDNVAFGLKLRGMDKAERRTKARDLMSVVGLAGQEHKYPSQLSGGMRQRIQIARVLATNSRVLLMDEPFGALDAQTRSELQDEVVRIWQETGTTALFITHDITEAILLGDRIGVMRHGPLANMREIIDVDLPRPRRRSLLAFGELYERVNQLIVEEVKLSRRSADAGR
jgi:NitT/TauT family transport system ATP-binding protein